MDSVIPMIGLIGGGAAIFGFGIGLWLGGRMVADHILTEVVNQGFLNLNGVRYRVDRIGRKPKESSQ